MGTSSILIYNMQLTSLYLDKFKYESYYSIILQRCYIAQPHFIYMVGCSTFLEDILDLNCPVPPSGLSSQHMYDLHDWLEEYICKPPLYFNAEPVHLYKVPISSSFRFSNGDIEVVPVDKMLPDIFKFKHSMSLGRDHNNVKFFLMSK